MDVRPALDTRGGEESPDLRQQPLVEHRLEAAREVDYAVLPAAGEALHLIGVVHHARVAGLRVRIVAAPVAEAEVVTELVHERAGLLARRADAVGEIAERHDEIRAADAAGVPA